MLKNPDEIEHEWCALQVRAGCSYFQSWGWIGVWLKQIAMEFQPLVVRVLYGGNLVGLGIFVRREIKRHLFITSSALFLNEYPFDGRDMSIEYNGLLADHDHVGAVYSELMRHLFNTDKSLDEVFFGATAVGADSLWCLIDAGARREKLKLQSLEVSSTWAVDLESVGTGVRAYLDTLSRNRRAQIQRSFRLYEASGSLRMEEAENVDMAMEYFSGLKNLHMSRWQSRGQQGSFANKRWEALHRALILARFQYKEVQLLRVCDSEGPIGYLYNFIWRRHVYVLQTGFRESADKRLMPGYVVHALAIAHNKKQGMEVYDLMHGDSLYKRLLCNRNDSLEWLVIQRRRPKFGLENLALMLVRHARKNAEAAGRLVTDLFRTEK